MNRQNVSESIDQVNKCFMIRNSLECRIERYLYSMNMQKSIAFCLSNAFHSLSYISYRFHG